MSRDIRIWLTIGILGLVVLFTLQNVVTVEVSFLFWTVKLPRAILLFVVLAIGILLGWILKSVHRHPQPPEQPPE